MTIKTVHNVETGEISEVNMTKAELDQLMADDKKMIDDKSALLIKEKNRESALLKLAALGLTPEEINAIS
jgi:hypothetical protein